VDVRAAQVFLAVAEELSFSRAASRLGMATSSVSECIRKIEDDVQQVLFDRTPRSVELTSFGRDLVDPVTHFLGAHQAVCDEIDHLKNRSELAVGALYGFGGPLLRAVEERLAVENDPLGLNVKVFDWEEPTCGLRTRECDAAILIGPTSLDPLLTRVPLGEQQRIALMPPDMGNENGGGTVVLDDVDRVGWIPLQVGDAVWEAAWRLDTLRPGPPKLKGDVQVRVEGMIEAIRAGLGATVTIEAFQRLYSPPGVRMVPVRDAPPLRVDLAFRGTIPGHDLSRLITLAARLCERQPWY
jgi:DNA-binding transcriptional LysR family regulator